MSHLNSVRHRRANYLSTLISGGRPTSFGAAYGVEPSTVITSRKAYPRGIDAGAAITASAGAEYSLDGGAWTSDAGVWGTTKQIRARITSSADYETTVTATITVGGVAYAFHVTTRAANVSPNALTFTSVTNANLSTAYTSNSQTIAGLEAEGSFTVTGGTAEKNGAGTFAASGTIINTDTIKLRGTSEATYLTPKVVTFTAGNTVATYTITTKAEPVGGGSEYDLTIDDEALAIDLETLTVDAV